MSSSNGLAAPPLVFVVGAPRSGTTMLSSMLNSHSQVSMSPETHYFTRLWPTLEHALEAGGIGVEAAIDFLLDTPEIKDMELSAAEVADLRRDIASLQLITHRGIYSAFVRTYAARAGKTVYGEKTPAYLLHIDLIESIFPGCRYVSILRDPRDVSLSWRRAGFRGGPVYHALMWRRFYKAARRHSAELPHNFLVVKYEDLLKNADSALSRCCRFLGVEFEPAMLAFYAAEKPNFDAAREPWKVKATTPLDPGNTDKWKTDLSPEHIAVMQLLLRRELRACGYAAAPIRVTPGLAVGMARLARGDLHLVVPRATPEPVKTVVRRLRGR